MMNTARSATVDAFARAPLPKRFCNLDRVLHAMRRAASTGSWRRSEQRLLPVVQRHRAQVRRAARYAVILSRHAPEHPVMVVADYYLATFLTQATWIEDIRPFRAVMMPLDLPAQQVRHRPIHPASRQRQAVGGECAQAVRL